MRGRKLVVRSAAGLGLLVGALAVMLASAATESNAGAVARSSSSALHARNGVIAYVHNERYNGGQIYAVTMTGADRHALTKFLVTGGPDSYSPNGKQILFGCRWNLCTMNADGSHIRPLTYTNKKFLFGAAAFSPNGKEIALTGFYGGLWVMDADGRDPRVVVPKSDCECDSVSWSPDGKEIAFSSSDFYTSPNPGPEQIYVVSASGGSATQLTHETSGNSTLGDSEPAWSPNGRKILFSSDRDGSRHERANNLEDIWMMNADGSDLQRVTHTQNLDESNPVWSPDGRWIAYQAICPAYPASQGDVAQIFVARPNGTHAHPVTHPCSPKYLSQNEVPIWQPKP